MCGIAGRISTPGDGETSALSAVMSRIAHRGPDDHGYLTYANGHIRCSRELDFTTPETEVVFLHRRLSIIDVTRAGSQPMGTPDGRYFITYNGEVYNYIELREYLANVGYQFLSHSDTEVILAAYSYWGSQCLRRLVGMFAFALLDTWTRSVFLARDPFGIKPLYYTSNSRNIAFASEPKALLEFQSTARQADPEAVYLYLRYGVCDYGPGTLLSHIRQLPPGHYAKISLDAPLEITPVTYWSASTTDRIDISFDDAARHLRDVFLRSIQLHLRSDVELGAALSGGIDSSSIVMAIKYLQPKTQVHCFSYVADDCSISEERWIDTIAAAANSFLHKVHATPDNLVSDLETLTYAQDEPFGSTSLYAQYSVFRAAKKAGIKVMLDGQGADEIFGGYDYVIAARLASLIRQRRWSDAAEFIYSVQRFARDRKLRIFLQSAAYLLPISIQNPLRRLVGRDLTPAWLKAQWFKDRGIVPHVLNHSTHGEVLKETLLHMLTSTSLPHLLRYEDRNSMASSIESRVPFLTTDMVDFVLRLPEEYIISRNGLTKAVFRKAMYGIVPDAILTRQDKIGFSTPEQAWLLRNEPWVRTLLSSPAAFEIPLIDVGVMQQDWAAMLVGRKRFDFRFWRWLNFIQWAQMFSVQFI
jgi:asparagine synthase (glutamine-hydrolysing)